MEEFFMIQENKIETGWNPPDKSLDIFVLDYCEEVLNIPLFLISEVSYSNEGIEIALCHLESWMLGEDWYVNLFRLSNYAMAS